MSNGVGDIKKLTYTYNSMVDYMYELVSIFLIGVSLSMDTFSLSLSLSAFTKDNKYLKLFLLLVGILHFIMPNIGNILGIGIMNIFNLAGNILLGLILIFLAISIAIEFYKNKKIDINLNLLSIILLSFSVSIDSFTVGLGISNITNNYLLSSLIFSILSMLFTYLGLIIGKYSKHLIGRFSNIIAILILLVLGIYHLF